MKNNPTALITGCARRIGQALAIALHQQGFDIAIHCLSSINAANQLSSLLNQQRENSTKVFTADLCNSDEIKKLSQNVLAWRPEINVLINNASLFYNDEKASLHWDDLFHCNVQAPYLLSHHFKITLEHNKGCIINLSDIHAHTPLKDYNIYCMTKAALHMQTLSLAKQLAPMVRVNAIAPGAILWPEDSNEINEDIKQKIIANTPLKIFGGTTPITQAALHFISNKFITGTSLAIDGGRSI